MLFTLPFGVGGFALPAPNGALVVFAALTRIWAKVRCAHPYLGQGSLRSGMDKAASAWITRLRRRCASGDNAWTSGFAVPTESLRDLTTR